MNPSIAQRIQRAKAAMQATQDARYQRTTRTALATVTSVNRDPISGYTDGTVWAAIDGVSDQRIFIGAGTGVQQGDTLRVENRSGPLSPDWVLVGKVGTSAGAEGLVDVDRILSTPTGLSLVSAAYAPTPGNLSARLTATWNQIGDWEGVRLYEAQLRRDADSTIHTSSVAHVNGDATASTTWGELFQNIDYSVRVRAIGYGGGLGGWTAWSSATTSTDSTAPATPTGLSAEEIDDYHLRVYWTANTEADLWYYQIDVGMDGSSSMASYPRTTGRTPSHGITVQPGRPYYARVRAYDTSGNVSSYTAWAGPFTTTARPSLAGLVYLQPWTELIATLSNVATTMDVIDDLYTSGEFVHLLAATGEGEVVKVTSSATSITGGYRYTISRNADGAGAIAHGIGARGYTLGQRGFILADSRDGVGHTDTPFLDIYEWPAPYSGTWGDRTHMVRMGNLSGITDPSFGALAGFGLWADNVYLHGQIAISNQGDIALGNLSGDLDDVGDGSTYGRIKQTIIGAGFIKVGGGTKDGTLSGWEIDNTEIVGQLSGVDQIVLNTSGQIVAGGGAVEIDADGVTFDGTISKFDSGAGVQFKDGATTLLRLGTWYNGATLLAAGLSTLNNNMMLRAGSYGLLVNADGGLSVGYQASPAGAWADRDVTCRGLIASGDISTDGGTNTWDLAGYTTTAPTATGYVSVTINGTPYKLIAAT